MQYGGVMTINGSYVTHSASSTAVIELVGGELHLVNATIEHSTAHSSSPADGVILRVPSNTIGAGPLLLATFTDFRQHICDGHLFSQIGAAQIVLREVSFTPLDGCDLTSLASPSAFAGVQPKSCGATCRPVPLKLTPAPNKLHPPLMTAASRCCRYRSRAAGTRCLRLRHDRGLFYPLARQHEP